MTTATIETVALMGTPAADLIKAIESLTHRIHEAPKPGRAVAAGRVPSIEEHAEAERRAEHLADLREQRRLAEAELVRRSDAAERALVTIETVERVLGSVDKVLTQTVRDDRDNVDATVNQTRDAISLLTEATTNTTCSLVKDQATSDRISAAASERVYAMADRLTEMNDAR